MPTREKLTALGRRRGDRLAREIGQIAKDARIGLGWSQEELSRKLDTSRTQLWRWESARPPYLTIPRAAVLLRVLGLDLAMTTYPAGGPLRDEAHARLVGRFLRILPAELPRRLEAPIPSAGYLRAWDVLLTMPTVRIGVAAETRLRDWQALLRREEGKARDGGVDRLLLVVAESHTNRRAVRDAGLSLTSAYPLDGRTVRRALQLGRDPGGNGLLFL
jgi:transcriptional regulator with XRE-family HTH domain